jgi:alcohol dehydrogenase, propanol-preferring
MWPMPQSETMAAYRIVRWGASPELTEAPVPEPGPGQVRVRVAGNGLCHSDIAMAAMPGEIGEALGWRLPFTLGHEVGGWIHALGPGVEGFAEGDPVALVSPSSCGVCGFCVRGQDSACPHGLVGRGYGRDGGLATYVVASAPRDLVRLESLDPVVAGPLMDAGATSYHAVRRVLPRLVPGSTAVVVGAGGLGGFAVQLLRALTPAQVIAVDPNPGRLAVATELGAHRVVAGVDDATAAPDVAAAVRDATGGEGAHAVLDFVGVDATIAAGVASVRSYGALAVVGATPRSSRSRGRRSRTPTRWCGWPRPGSSAARWTCSPSPTSAPPTSGSTGGSCGDERWSRRDGEWCWLPHDA